MLLAEDCPILLAELVCSDDECGLTLEAEDDLTELNLLVCDDCGCCLQVVSLSAYEAGALAALRAPARRLSGRRATA